MESLARHDSTAVGAGRDLLPDVGQMFRQKEKRKRKKQHRFRTANLNLDQITRAAYVNLAAFDPLIVDLTAANGENRLSEPAWKLRHEAHKPEVLFLRSGGADDDFCQNVSKSQQAVQTAFRLHVRREAEVQKKSAGGLGLRFSNKIMPGINLGDIYIPKQSRYI